MPLLMLGARSVVRWHPIPVAGRALRAIALGAITVIGVGYGAYNVWGYRDRWWANMQRDIGRPVKPVVEWVASATAPGDVLVTDHDLVVYLYTGRQAVPPVTFHARSRVAPLTLDEDTEMLRAILALYHPTFYVATAPYTAMIAKRLAAETPPRLRPVRDMGAVVIFRPTSQWP